MNMRQINENTIVIVDCHHLAEKAAPSCARAEEKGLCSYLKDMWKQSKGYMNSDIETSRLFVTRRDVLGDCSFLFMDSAEAFGGWTSGALRLPAAFERARLVIINDTRSETDYGNRFVRAIDSVRGPVVRSEDRKVPVLAPYAMLAAGGYNVLPVSYFASQEHQNQMKDAMTNGPFAKAVRDAIVYRVMSAVSPRQNVLRATSVRPSLG